MSRNGIVSRAHARARSPLTTKESECPHCRLPVSAKQPGSAAREAAPPQNGAAPLTDAQLTQLVSALQAARDGDFSVRLRAEGALARSPRRSTRSSSGTSA